MSRPAKAFFLLFYFWLGGFAKEMNKREHDVE